MTLKMYERLVYNIIYNGMWMRIWMEEEKKRFWILPFQFDEFLSFLSFMVNYKWKSTMEMWENIKKKSYACGSHERGFKNYKM